LYRKTESDEERAELIVKHPTLSIFPRATLRRDQPPSLSLGIHATYSARGGKMDENRKRTNGEL
jgi:hypothetical protein